MYFPLQPSQSLTDLSNDPLAMNLPSGENATHMTCCWCPVILAIGFDDVFGLHKINDPSSDL